jgi:hypothetical protein
MTQGVMSLTSVTQRAIIEGNETHTMKLMTLREIAITAMTLSIMTLTKMTLTTMTEG